MQKANLDSVKKSKCESQLKSKYVLLNIPTAIVFYSVSCLISDMKETKYKSCRSSILSLRDQITAIYLPYFSKPIFGTYKQT